MGERIGFHVHPPAFQPQWLAPWTPWSPRQTSFGGVNGHPITAYPGVRIDRQLDFIEDLGLKSYRVNISSETNADDLAALVAAAKKRGIEMLPVIFPQAVDLEKDSPD
jgi:hypothetical protein